MPAPEQPTVSVPEAAAKLGISPRTAYRLARENKLPVPVLKVGRGYRVPTAKLNDALGLDPTHE